MPKGIQSLATSVVSRLPRNETLKRGVQSLGVPDRLTRYQDVFSTRAGGDGERPFPRSQRLVSGTWCESMRPLLPQMEKLDELGGFQLVEIRSSLPDELLMYADKLSMAHSLEARVPYLDRTDCRICAAAGCQFQNPPRRAQMAAPARVPKNSCRRAILKRKKRGFAVNVVDEWFNAGAKGKMTDLLLDENSLMFSLLDPKPVRTTAGRTSIAPARQRTSCCSAWLCSNSGCARRICRVELFYGCDLCRGTGKRERSAGAVGGD